MRRAFTLVEILVVVVILGILAAIVVPQFNNATIEAKKGATLDQLVKIRDAVAVYYVRQGNVFPDVTAGTGTWGALVATTGEYLKVPPRNKWVQVGHETDIVIGSGPDLAYDGTHGWIYDPATGSIWAGSYDMNDQPYPHP
jgi:general secretion pathway protein G